MHPIKSILVLATIIILVSAALALLVVDAGMQPHRAERSEDFQRLVGGLGFGPALDLARCPAGFDPRLDSGGTDSDQILLGPARICPQQGGSIFHYPPLARSGPACSAGE
jgi:hypothetical protein